MVDGLDLVKMKKKKTNKKEPEVIWSLQYAEAIRTKSNKTILESMPMVLYRV